MKWSVRSVMYCEIYMMGEYIVNLAFFVDIVM